ncbi:MAG TPA: HEAT repeat domain-containing protein [Flavipsychrobacter sp.]|nr:HEAT repeat domain-containing protein [Flavipsychrobacter sp.]
MQAKTRIRQSLVMSFYNLNKQERSDAVATIKKVILQECAGRCINKTLTYFSDEDTYIRKAAYLSTGRIYFKHEDLRERILLYLLHFLLHDDFRVRQTAINAAGEIGKKSFGVVQHFFDTGLFDKHHAPRNAVIGSIKKMGEVNPQPILAWAKKYLHHPDKEIRREICHGIELRGRKHPEDILPHLKELQHDGTARVRDTLVHVLGQIAYKKGCLKIVVADLKTWENQKLVADALEEIIDVHNRYRNFAAMTQDEAREYITHHF